MAARSIPEALDVENFAQARIQELEFLDAAVAAATAEGGDRGDRGGVGGAGVATPPASAGGLRDQAKAVPRHMRRRAASHKPRRMPVALKIKDAANGSYSRRRGGGGGGGGGGNKQHEVEGSVKDARRCRKHRRRPKALLAMHSPHAAREDPQEGGGKQAGEGGYQGLAGGKQSPPRWLETHIWHAKRMHMKEVWGFMLPAESNRGPRAAAEAALKHCTLQDATFLRPLELSGPHGGILGVLSAVTDPLDARVTRQESCVDGFVEAKTHLYRVNEFPLGCIAPASLMWSPPDAIETGGGGGGEEGGDAAIRRVWVWVHPAAANEALREMKRACGLVGAPWQGTVEAGPVSGGLCRLRVRGTRSHEIMQRVLRTAGEPPAAAVTVGDGFEEAARDNAAHWRALQLPRGRCGENQSAGAGGPEGPRQLPPGSVLAINALDPREQRRRPTPSAKAEALAASGPAAASGSNTAQDSGKSSTQPGKSIRRGGTHPAGSGPTDPASVLPMAAVREWPPRWAAVSPLWNHEARSFSAQLAAARPDHVLNDARRRERRGQAWDNESDSTAAGVAAAMNGDDGARPLGPSGGSDRAAVPVILVSASGVPTTAHEESAPTHVADSFFAGDLSGGGRRVDRREKEAERKRRAVAAGWDLIVPPGWAPVFFCALVMAGARAVSLKDADGLVHEAGESRFPADYPDTAAGRRHWEEVGRLSEAAWTRTRPKHRGFKLPRHHLPPPPPPPPPLSRAGDHEAAAAQDGSGEGEGAGRLLLQERLLLKQEERKVKPDSAEPPSWPPPPPHQHHHFRPKFRSLAAGGVVAGSVVEAGDAPGGEEEREPYAVARGYQYVRAFLPSPEDEKAAAAAEAIGEGDRNRATSLPPLPPPLRLAFPTVLEVLISLDKGVPKPGALVHAASAEHYALWMRGRRDGISWPGFALPNPTQSSSSLPLPTGASLAGGGVGYDDDTAAAARGEGEGADEKPEQEEAPTGQALPPLVAVGAVTSGGFSFLRGRGTGRAVCEAVAVRDALLLSSYFRRRQEVIGGSGDGGEGGSGSEEGAAGQRRWLQQERRPWALVLVGNEAGGWLRPAVASLATS